MGAGGVTPSPSPLFSSLVLLYEKYDRDDICAGILEQSVGARNRVGKGLSYRPAMLGYIVWRNRFLGTDSWAPLNFKIPSQIPRVTAELTVLKKACKISLNNLSRPKRSQKTLHTATLLKLLREEGRDLN